MTKREAYLIGRETGNSIAKSNIHEFLSIRKTIEERKHGLQTFCVSVSETESEHYRQFSPFEFTAKDFNESHDPDGMWSEYEKGVWNGSKQTFHKLNRRQK